MTAPTPGAAIPHLRVSWGGFLGTGGEIWSNTKAWSLSTAEAPTAAELEAITVAAAEPLTNLVSFAGVQVSPAVTFAWVKAVWLLNTGRQRDVNTAMYEFPAAGRPRGAGAAVPWTQTYAVTLRTAVQRGRGHAGRLFPPPCGPMPEGQTPYAPAAFADSLSANYAVALNGLRAAINEALAGDPTVRAADLVVSSRRTADGRAAMLTEVTSCVVDRVADVMHSRTNRVPRLEGATNAIN